MKKGGSLQGCKGVGMNLVGWIMAAALLLFGAFALFMVGGWLLLIAVAGGVWLLRSWLRSPDSDQSTAPDVAPPSTSNTSPLVTARGPSAQELEQIEQARQSSLATLREHEARDRAKARQEKQRARRPAPLDPIDLPDRVEFTYTKSDGAVSRRVVKVNKCDPDAGTVMGWCEDSGAIKTFKVERMGAEVVRYATGEITSPWAWFSALRSASQGR